MRPWARFGFWLPLAAVFVWGLAVLLIGEDTLRETTFTLMMFVGMASSLNILLGYTGYVSFGHIVFFGLGAISVSIFSVSRASGSCRRRWGAGSSPGCWRASWAWRCCA